MSFVTVGFLKEATYSFIVFSITLLIGCNHGFCIFLFSQNELLDCKMTTLKENFSWIVSLPFLFRPLGCILAGATMDVNGRKIIVNCTFVLFIFSWLLIGFAQNVFTLYFAMIIAGIASGGSVCDSVYISEICSIKYRTFLLSAGQFSYMIGLLLSRVLTCYFEWYTAAFVASAFSAVCLFSSFFVPESPTWLRLNGHFGKSVQVLSSIRCKDASSLQDEIKEIDDLCQLYRENDTNLRNNCKTIRLFWKPLAILTLVFCLSQNAGLACFRAYTTMIVDRLNVVPSDSSKVALFCSFAGLASGCIAPVFANKLGRKYNLAVCGLGIAISAIIVAIYEEITYTYDEDFELRGWIPAITITAYSFFLVLGPACTLLTVGGELFPREVAGIMNGMYGAFGFIYTGLLVKSFPVILLHFGIKACLWFVACSGVLLSVCTIRLLPETRGKSLLRIQKQYFWVEEEPRGTSDDIEISKL